LLQCAHYHLLLLLLHQLLFQLLLLLLLSLTVLQDALNQLVQLCRAHACLRARACTRRSTA
jgi:hypothetical protein